MGRASHCWSIRTFMLLNIQRYYVVVFCWSSVTTLAVSRKHVPAVQIILNTATFPFPASPVDTYTMVNIALRDAPAPSEFKSPIFTLKDNAHCLNISRKWSVTQIFGFTKDFRFIKRKQVPRGIEEQWGNPRNPESPGTESSMFTNDFAVSTRTFLSQFCTHVVGAQTREKIVTPRFLLSPTHRAALAGTPSAFFTPNSLAVNEANHRWNGKERRIGRRSAGREGGYNVAGQPPHFPRRKYYAKRKMAPEDPLLPTEWGCLHRGSHGAARPSPGSPHSTWLTHTTGTSK